MAVLRGILGILAGIAVAVIFGAVIDYLHIYEQGKYYPYLFPWIAGVGGALASIIAILIRGGAGTAQVKVAGKVKYEAAAAERTSAKPSTTAAAGSEVPGMPTFDFESMKKDEFSSLKQAEDKTGLGSRPSDKEGG